MNEELLKKANFSIKTRVDWLQQAITAQILANFLPEKVQDLKITDIDLSSDGTKLYVDISGQDAFETLKELGATGFKPHYSGWAKYWYFTNGTLNLVPGYTAVFKVYHTDKPPRCHIETKTRTITEEVAVCEDTGNEV